MAEGSGLLNRRAGKTRTGGSNPPPSANKRKKKGSPFEAAFPVFDLRNFRYDSF